MKNKKYIKYIWIVSLIVILIIADQIIKLYMCNNLYNSSIVGIKNLINITYIENKGGAYGIGDNSTIIFIISNILIIGLIIKFLLSKKDKMKLSTIIALSLIMSGGIGNLIDRICRGFVVDYIDISTIIKFPVFNLADICINVGVGILIILLIKDIIKDNQSGDNKNEKI